MIFTVKLLPQIKKSNLEIELAESEFIKVRKLWMEERYFPFDSSTSLETQTLKKYAKKYIPLNFIK